MKNQKKTMAMLPMVALSPSARLDDEREELGSLFGPSKQQKLETEKEKLKKLVEDKGKASEIGQGALSNIYDKEIKQTMEKIKRLEAELKPSS